MIENERYFRNEWEEECCFFNPTEISEKKVDEKSKYIMKGIINISYDDFKKEGDKMKNDNFETILRSQDVQSHVLSKIEVNCRKYETFKKIIDAVMPILEKEDGDLE